MLDQVYRLTPLPPTSLRLDAMMSVSLVGLGLQAWTLSRLECLPTVKGAAVGPTRIPVLGAEAAGLEAWQARMFTDG